MNLLTLLATANSTILLLLTGIALLLITTIYGLVRTWRGHLKAGWFTVALTLVACLLVGLGAVQAASASAALGAATARFGAGAPPAGAGTRFARPGGQNAASAANATQAATTSAASNDGLQPASDAQGTVAADSGDNAQAPVATAAAGDATQQAAGTPGRRFSGTRGAPPAGGSTTGNGPRPGSTGGTDTAAGAGTTGTTTGNGTGGGTGTTGGTGTGGTGTGTGGGTTGGNAPVGPNSANFAGGAAANLVSTVQLDQSALPTIVLGGLLATVFALGLFFFERRRDDFSAANSRGLLLAGAGFFVVIAVLLVPIIPGQITGTVSAAAFTPRANRSVALAPSATPSPVPTSTGTPTALPSLTPVLTDTPVAMPTQIAYASTYTSAMQNSVCTAVANAPLSLRGDPSNSQQAIGRIIAGSLLNVQGMSTDKKWLRVITNTDNDVNLEGWVSVQFATLNSSCAGQGVPVVDAIGNIIQTSAPPVTAGSTDAATTSINTDVTTAPCTLLTTSAASLRPDPSLAHVPLASIPAQTALIGSGKSANGQWWQVSYGSANGWIGAGAVLASTTCASAPTVAATAAS